MQFTGAYKGLFIICTSSLCYRNRRISNFFLDIFLNMNSLHIFKVQDKYNFWIRRWNKIFNSELMKTICRLVDMFGGSVNACVWNQEHKQHSYFHDTWTVPRVDIITFALEYTLLIFVCAKTCFSFFYVDVGVNYLCY